MSQANADRNLLLGILAYQNAFVTRDALFAGMQAWLYDKARPLAEILQHQGALDVERRQLLDALVAQHVKQHDGDPAKSLQAVGCFGSVRQDLEQVADPDVQASLVHLSQARKDDDPDRTRTFADASTLAGTRFRRLRPHARGGLGEVFVAVDTELNREVALKEIQDHYADHPDSRARFLQEAEITGGLEHPGIVPVYGLGAYVSGRPFYAMRFIRGESFKDAIARFHDTAKSGRPASESTLELRKLLDQLIAVCNAIEYAHSRGILHRDLKPSNIMVGKYGETLVVDWGLAKVLMQANDAATEGVLGSSRNRSSAMTQMGAALGTPAFMSPEQADGRLDRVGPRSDVYSLGATLYCLLTGKAPFSRKDTPAILEDVRRGVFPRPRQLAATIPPALEAICIKAMALRPEDRYASPQFMADDLRKWLADEPVSAYSEPRMQRFARWRRRYSTLARVLRLLLVVLGAALVFLVFYTLAMRSAVLHEIEVAKQFRSELDLSETRAWALTHDYAKTLREDPELHAAAIEPLRKKLLTQLQVKIRIIAQEQTPGVLPRYKEHARVHALLGSLSRAVGDKEEALQAYLQALELYQQQFSRYPELGIHGGSIVETQMRLGELYQEANRPDDAETAFRDALVLSQDLVNHSQMGKYFRHQLASAHHALGMFQYTSGRLKDAEASLETARRLQQTLVAEDQDGRDTLAAADLGRTMCTSGHVFRESGRLQAAVKSYGASIGILEQILARTDCPLTARAVWTEAQKGRDEAELKLKEAPK